MTGAVMSNVVKLVNNFVLVFALYMHTAASMHDAMPQFLSHQISLEKKYKIGGC